MRLEWGFPGPRTALAGAVFLLTGFHLQQGSRGCPTTGEHEV